MGEVKQEPSYLAIQYLHDTKNYPISKLCAALHIPRCSYYKWLKRDKNRNELLNEQIIEWIKALYIGRDYKIEIDFNVTFAAFQNCCIQDGEASTMQMLQSHTA